MMIFTAAVIGAAVFAGMYFISHAEIQLGIMFLFMAAVVYVNKDVK